jgi:hypothetical protein
MNAILIHDEMLNPEAEIYKKVPTPQIFLFVFDPQWMQEEGWTLKRIQFVCDGLMEIPTAQIYRGEISAIVRELGITSFTTQATPNPHTRAMWRRACVPVTEIDESAFAQFDKRLTRFMSFWKAIEAQFFGKEAAQKSLF